MTMKFRLSLPFLFYIAITAMVFSSCSDDDNNGENKYADWKNRNDAYFLSVLNEADRQIKLAKQEYPLEWEEHCDWRTYQSYSLAQGSTSNSAEDSICVKILRKGTGSGVPLSTDSCTNPPLNGLYGFNLPKLYICSKFLSNEIDTCENSQCV